MFRELYDGEYDPRYFSVDTKDAADSIFENLKNKLAANNRNKESIIISDEFSDEETSKTEAFIRMQRSSENIVSYSSDNQIWNDYIEVFWGGFFRAYGFQCDFYRREFLKDKDLLLALANFYKTPDDEKLNHLRSLFEKQQFDVNVSGLIFSVRKELYLPSCDFIIKHLSKCISMITNEKLTAPSYYSKDSIEYLTAKKEYFLKLLEMYDIRPSSYEEELKCSSLLETCICEYYDSDKYRNDLGEILARNQEICAAIDDMYDK
ncbi:hypothetical protein SAMN02910357_00043 [Succinivibrio dextrinosolvens]|uniref:hypothetical protein n=1 Tax=Succinivibrio dextrinosolvens TaxID=83771 RepID=UPI0008EC2EFD|nr:hypothetical protein [Succinivibrio dextrinosolvens]SFS31579.1 hypothetical protein SAMN02910357_00043 [Succinivibrio dextrinosolvens]